MNRPDIPPVPSYRFEPLDRIRFGGVDYVYLRPTEAGHVLRQRNGSLEEAFGNTEMHRIVHSHGFGHDRGFYAEGNTHARERSGVASMNGIPASERPHIMWKYNFCVRFLAMERRRETSRSDRKMKAAIATIQRDIVASGGLEPGAAAPDGRKARSGSSVTFKTAPSPRTLRKWLSTLLVSGSRAHALRDAYRECGNREPRLRPEIYEMIRLTADNYKTEKQPSIKMCRDDLLLALESVNKAREANGQPKLDPPSIKAVTKAIKEMPAFEVLAGREGLDAAKRHFRLVKGSPEATRPGERVEMDEWTVHLQKILTKAAIWAKLQEEVREALVGRWLVCAAIDVASRCFLGLRLAPTATGSVARATLQMVVSDKDRYAKAVGAVTPWDMTLNPDLIVTDGGAGLTSNEFTAAAADLGSDHDVATNGMPHLRGTIERAFGTLDTGLLPFFTGRTFSNVRQKGDYDAEARASLTKEDFASALIIFAVDAYHNRPHGGLSGETPRNAWLRLADLYGVCPPPGRDDRRAIFGTELTRVANMKGVRFLGLQYLDETLGAELLARDTFETSIRIDEEDLGRISVLVGQEWHTLPCLSNGFDGVDAATWIAAMMDLRRRFADEALISRPVVLGAIAAIKAIAASAEKTAGIEVAGIGQERLDAAEREIMGGFVMPMDDYDNAKSEATADPFQATIRCGPGPDRDPEPKPETDQPGPRFTIEDEE